MTHQRLNPGPRMSQAVCVGGLAFLAGQVPDDLDADISEQTRQVLAKIDGIVEALGRTKADIATVQVWLSDMDGFQGMNDVWDGWVDRDAPPARATGGVALARPGMKVEMIAVVALGQAG